MQGTNLTRLRTARADRPPPLSRLEQVLEEVGVGAGKMRKRRTVGTTIVSTAPGHDLPPRILSGYSSLPSSRTVGMSSGCAGRMTLPHKEAEQDCPPEKIKADSHPLVVGRFFFRPFYVLKNKAGLPPHCTLIIAIARSRISIANRRLAVLYPTLFARL